ncbi:serine O-acetyltransferase [Sulfurospirillum diekertiae]|uniref:serine O-acetyltransferase n=1 Tax=Sulfurospirillum diekertiae TaxID=1854492 RepID=A0A1Y0HL91_9BACT|nr:serine O-acetyltransferase [Sulfurospirillum diekertiae]ARU48869.1 Serine acetyltransferase [Sulfurospirillum diekertiae]ASC93689.1 Serine acetyltransferase [Sulfurospirillum diekertiae]QIR74807.1 serine O-acetyltransferase [Sulfurospirillum diekertiae]QIR77471.1 serine O-acetyltransferase [Sulfurospirillum diekertiae]
MNSVSLWEKIKEDFSQPILHDPAINSKIELFFNYPGVWALANYRIAHALHVKGFRTLARAIMGISQIITNIDIHPASTIGRRVFLDHAFGVVIGETAIVGDDVLIYQGVTLGGVSLDRGVKRHPTIGNHTVIGSGAKILGDIIIGENCRIGSNSVVVKSIPNDSTAVGVPARIIDKGRDKNPMAHNKIPDINKELFIYMFKRIKILEEAVLTTNKDLKIKDDELEAIYKCYLESVKE